MTREQAAKDYALRNCPVIHEEIAKTAFLAGCEHADKEHRERIEQQAQEIERLKKDAADYMELMSGKVTHQKNRIAELEAQLNDAIDLAYRGINCADYAHISTIREIQKELLALPKALESSPKEQPEAQKEDLDKMFKQWTEPEAQQQENKLFVEYANFWYEVADFSKEFGVQWVHIYDEPPSKHIDRVQLANTTGIKFKPL